MKFIDLTGLTVGKWRVIARIGSTTKWRCVCACGTSREIYGHTLREERSLSCGCERKAAVALKRNASGADWKATAKAQAAARAAMATQQRREVGAYAARLRSKHF